VFALGDEVIGRLLDLIGGQGRVRAWRRHIVHGWEADFRATRHETGQACGKQASEHKLCTRFVPVHAAPRCPNKPIICPTGVLRTPSLE